MADVFISYARADRKKIEFILNGLKAAKINYFLDSQMNLTDAWKERLNAELLRAKYVLVLWTESSVQSREVLRELTLASDNGVVVAQAVLDRGIQVPDPYGVLNAADLTRWTGADFGFAHWRELVESLGGVAVTSNRVDSFVATNIDLDLQIVIFFENEAALSRELRRLLRSGYSVTAIGTDFIALRRSGGLIYRLIQNALEVLYGSKAKLYSGDRIDDEYVRVLQLNRSTSKKEMCL